jgi:tRNA nucleotidyltransferase (CCA-adding enzyme)
MNRGIGLVVKYVLAKDESGVRFSYPALLTIMENKTPIVSRETLAAIPVEVLAVTNALEAAGFQAFIVGGCVRDLIIGRTPKDWDITTDATPEQIQSLFVKTVYENRFGTVAVINEDLPLESTVRTIEVTPFRTESEYSDFRHPDEVSFAKTIEEDLSRRDFTMNALALRSGYATSLDHKRHEEKIKDTESKRHEIFIKDTILDLYGGIKDIESGIIKTVGDAETRFTEDALRMVRAVRFSAELGFTLSDDVSRAITAKEDLLKHVSQERLRDEFVKIVSSPQPAMGIMFLAKLGLVKHMIPELLEGDQVEQGGVHVYDVLQHLLHALQHATDKGYPFHVKLAALFHDIGKPRTRRPGQKKAYTFYGHEVVGARMTEKIMNRMKFPKADIDMVVKLVRWHMFFSDTEAITLSAVRRMIQNVGPENIWTLMQVRECDRVGMRKAEAPYRLRKYFAMIEECLRDPISVSQLKVDGNYLMNELNVAPGRRMGWMLHALLEEVLEEPERNTVEYLSDRVKHLETIPDAELKELGEKGKQTKEEADEAEVQKLHVKHNVKK